MSHGTELRYSRGCRCENCLEAHAREMRYFKPEKKPGRQEPTTFWTARAACAGYPTEWFYPEHGFPPEEAFALCRRCPVAEECRQEGKREFGLWGGVYRGHKKAHRYRAEVRCAACNAVFLRDEGSVDRKCDSCCTPVELTLREARNRKRQERSRAAVERETRAFERLIELSEDEFGKVNW